MYLFFILQDNIQLTTDSYPEDENDNRPDEQKAFENIPTEVSLIFIHVSFVS